MENIAIYNNIQAKAKEAGISINSIEKEAELATGSICKWNEVSPSVRSLKKVANVLNCTVDDLLEDEPSKGGE